MTQMRSPQRSPNVLSKKGAASSPVVETPPADISFPLIEAPPRHRAYQAVKRVMDVSLASAGLLALSPVVAAVALAIKMDSPGPILFKQTRVGERGKTFGMYKFRSMRTDAEHLKEKLQHLNERNGPVFKIKNDPRITRLGKFLRKYSVDEIPQLINVIRGEMSLIGPRPPLPSEVAIYQPHHFRRLETTPGITGLWQVTARDASDFEEWVRLDVKYIENQSLMLDLWILAKTPMAVISARGAS